MIGAAELADLESAVLEAFRTGRQDHLRVLGYGEITSAVGWPTDAPVWACKRLPPFRDAAQLEAYRACVAAYIDALEANGVAVVPTELASVPGDGRVAYLVQPVLAAERLAPRYLADCEPEAAQAVIDQLVANVCRVVGPRLGLDGQLSNWVVQPDCSLAYLDVTTPMLRDDGGRDRLDADLFLASLPWAVRRFVLRFVLKSVLDKYYDRRGVLLDAVGNLHKERLLPWMPAFVASVGAHVSPAITEAEGARYYRSDARTWALLQRLRRFDRAWQRGVRRRPYPFLLPGRIAR